ncbi:unnamed protein product [Microthlaspi erraticum]|uniref:Uncharacterized protein n=1 Tax=Microthlaspi erraticum TaxID=1685480 RepID=A0A6D2IUI6_9BRAS|nr:unnamed protein product [Microthlaspi erraticum]
MKSEASETNYDWLDLGTEPFRKGSRLGKDPEVTTSLSADENSIIHPVEVENGRVNTNNGRVNPLLVPDAEAPVTNAATTAPMQDFAVRIAATQAPHHQRRTSYPYWTNPFPDDDKKHHDNRL